MFYFKIKEICGILCTFGKTWLCLVLHDFNLTYYSSIILGSFSILLFPKLCWHIGLTPIHILPGLIATIYIDGYRISVMSVMLPQNQSPGPRMAVIDSICNHRWSPWMIQ